jgi:hypothetical protein
MRRTAVALLAATLVAVLAVIGSPSPCGACSPSGGPGELLYLRLESVQTDTAALPSGPIYSATNATISGVGSSLTLYLRVGDTNVAVDFAK